MVFTCSIPTAVFALENDAAKEVTVENEANSVEDDSAEKASEKDAESSDDSKDDANKASASKLKKAAKAPMTLDGNTVYVSEGAANDDSAELGSKDNPYKSLKAAVDAVDEMSGDEYVIEILSNLTATKCARINGKDIILKGNGYTITRGENFAQIQDAARSTYNPAIIEVCNSGSRNTASIRLENITISDNGLTAGTKYSQATTDGKGGNGDTVQDGIIATYDGVGTITLGNGAVLDGYGGMSAVRISGGTLIMESGSKITGGKNFTTKSGGNGPAGAVWSQGGSLTMNAGSAIDGVSGRAVYIDGGLATVNGTISNIKGNLNMWQGESGVAIHVRNSGYAVLGETGVIENITGDHAGYRGAVMTNGSRGEGLYDFEAKEGSIIRTVTDFPTLYSNYGTELLNGLITECSNDFIIGGFAQKTTIGETGVIENCTASKGAANAIVYTSNASKVYLRGKVQNNNASYGFYIINQSGGGASLEMFDGALISDNSSTAVYINASGSSFMMHGGIIEKNGSYGVYTREKANSPASFTMEDGIIRNNKSYGVYYSTNSGKTGRVNIIGGEISGNGSSSSPYQISISGANSEDTLSRVYIKPGIVKAANDKLDIINTSFAQITDINLGDGNEDFYVGNAKSAASNKIKELVKSYKETPDDINTYEAKGSALWFKTPDSNLEFNATRSSSVNKALPLYIAYIPVKEDGTPEEGANVTIKKVKNEDIVKIELNELTKDQSYAMMWMQPSENFGYIELKGTPEISEELGVTEYIVDYEATYTLLKDIASLAQPGDEFTLNVKLDDRLTYDETLDNAEVSLAESEAFELVRTQYNSNESTLAVVLKIKEGFEPKYSFSKYPAVVSFKTKAAVDDFEADNIRTDASISSSIVLSGDIFATDFSLDILEPVETKLIPLPTYTVTYEFVSGTAGRDIPDSVGRYLPSEIKLKKGMDAKAAVLETTEVLVNDGTWSFDGYDIEEINGITENIKITGTWHFTEGNTNPPVEPTNPVNLTNPPNNGGGGNAPAAAAPAGGAAALVAVPAGNVPLANIDADDDLTEIQDEETPLAKGPSGHWALLNLILAIFTALVSVLLLVFYFKGKNDDEDVEVKRMGLFRLLSIVPAIVSVVFFILTEDMSLPMAITDKWTLLMAVFAVINVVLAFFSKKKEEEITTE